MGGTNTVLMMVVGAGLITRAYLSAAHPPAPTLLEMQRELDEAG